MSQTTCKTIALVLVSVCCASMAMGQTSSLSARKRKDDKKAPPQPQPRVKETPRMSKVIENYSWTAIKPDPPKEYKVNDLLTIVVRQQIDYEAEADFKSDKKYDLKSQIDAFLALSGGQLAASEFDRGKPDVGYKYQQKVDGEADKSRQDRLTTRITAKVLDVKPNGSLVLEANSHFEHDEEETTITLTGMCRKEDVTADNTVLSTQLADLSLKVESDGDLTDSAKKGWIPRLIDTIRPF